MKRFSFKILTLLCCISLTSIAQGQMPTGSLGATNTPSSVMGAGQTTPPTVELSKPAETNSGSATTQPTEPKTERPTSTEKKPTSAASTPSKPGVPLYDPYMDNHLKAPASGKEIGLFGLPVKQVEDMLRNSGAKNHSYAFGKYSRLVFSVYLVTLYFDKERKLGGFSIEPRPPYKTVEPGARQFFMDTFLKGADLSRFSITMASNILEIKYMP